MPLEPSIESLRDVLLQGGEALGLSLSEAQCTALLGYIGLMQKWNGVYNLTALRRPAEMVTHHLLDSLAVLPALRRHLADKPARILDVGSGGGLPGVVLAILEPQLEVTCVDTVGKKAIFVRQVGVELKLANLFAVHARVEDLRLPPFDLITSRAFASLADFTRLTRHLAGERSVWMAMKGKRPDDEIAELTSDLSVFHVEQLAVPGLAAERCLVWIRKSSTV
jgi:16S rRNA (guanine527-N7)-methyltransferase